MWAVVFDFDGVLVNSEPLHYRALRESLQQEGIAITESEYASHYLAYSDRETVRIAHEIHGRPIDLARVDAVAERKAAIFDRLMAEVPFFPGARELVRALAAEAPVAIASGALRHEIETIVEQGGIRDCFRAIVGADDVRQCKPHPEPYLAALARLQRTAPELTAADCVVFEDTGAGIAAARAAGMTVVGVAQTYPAARLGGAHHVIAALADVGVADVPRFLGR
jgi:beta-phosphoglucomutase